MFGTLALLAACTGADVSDEQEQSPSVEDQEIVNVDGEELPAGNNETNTPATEPEEDGGEGFEPESDLQKLEFDPAPAECPEDFPTAIDADGDGAIDGCVE